MAASEENQPVCLREDALTIVQTLQRAGHIAYFAGGCVRDMLWNLSPKDFDVATDAPPPRVRELFPRSQGVGQAFGVVLVRQGKSQIEVATFRADGSYSDGRRPDDVRFATPQEDAQRRDFTINGVFYDPIANVVIDFVNGQADLASRTLRAIGDPTKRFAEDYLRMLRAIRFTSRFDLKVDPSTEAAIRANAHKLPRIAPERICDELRATFASPNRMKSVTLLDELGLTNVLLRGIAPSRTTGGAEHALFRSLVGGNVPFVLSLVLFTIDTLLHAGERLDALFAPPRTQQICHQLRHLFRLSNEETDDVKTMLDAGLLLEPAMPGVAQIKRYLARPRSELGVHLIQSLAGAGFYVERVRELHANFSSYEASQIAPEPLVDGADLQSLGYTPGPAFKRVLDAVYDAQLESRVREKVAGLELAKTLMERLAGQPD